MKGVTITRQVGIARGADDWSLYSEMKGVDLFADSLNTTTGRCFNRGGTWEQTCDQAYQLMRHNAGYGATDSGPVEILELLLNKLYPRNGE